VSAGWSGSATARSSPPARADQAAAYLFTMIAS
jgi:hypothetical protein